MSFAIVGQSKTNSVADGKTFTSAKHSPAHNNYLRITTLNNDHSSDSILYLQRVIGNQAVQRLVRSKNNNAKGFEFAKIAIQPKLKISQPSDEYEQEADRVADQVMRMPDPSDSVVMSQSTAIVEDRIDRKCAACEMKKEDDEDKKLQLSRKLSTTDKSNLESNEDIANEINDIRSTNGFPLDASTEEFMESRLGYNLSNVRIHTEEYTARSANSVNALAYTVGNNVIFGAARYQRNTLEGQRLLAHELTHVIQQNAGRVSGIQRRPPWLSEEDPFEREAEESGRNLKRRGLGSTLSYHEAMETVLPPKLRPPSAQLRDVSEPVLESERNMFDNLRAFLGGLPGRLRQKISGGGGKDEPWLSSSNPNIQTVLRVLDGLVEDLNLKRLVIRFDQPPGTNKLAEL